ncbi:MAG: hypothetical protein HXS41_11020 [Theionarchaea archaeon]|nr:hypothetical protein [Theionarchaea archaeon]MBU7000534.1 hypothetical protein [Theionarchaea archaeon]MBU7021577.1 hypothetical protein [Theionarchaea archaeon]MBU7034108.1 hypothetical protein [Theionarchaea archaeon]MBU7039947.1 hypothetical protein [Theionarchaea archaeon]
MQRELFDILSLYGLSVEYPRSWKIIIESRQVTFQEGKVNALGNDILMGLLWEKVERAITLEEYEERVLTNLKKKDKKFKLTRKEVTEISGHRAFKETMETRGRSGFVGLKKGAVEHSHCMFFCDFHRRFVTVYVSLVPSLRAEHQPVIDEIFDSIRCIH